MWKVIILRKIHVKVKSTPPQFSTIERNKTYSRLSCRCITEWDISIGANARSSHWRSSVKKDVLKNFSKFTGKHLCQSLFFIEAADFTFFYRTAPDDCF